MAGDAHLSERGAARVPAARRRAGSLGLEMRKRTSQYWFLEYHGNVGEVGQVMTLDQLERNLARPKADDVCGFQR